MIFPCHELVKDTLLLLKKSIIYVGIVCSVNHCEIQIKKLNIVLTQLVECATRSIFRSNHTWKIFLVKHLENDHENKKQHEWRNNLKPHDGQCLTLSGTNIGNTIIAKPK